MCPQIIQGDMEVCGDLPFPSLLFALFLSFGDVLSKNMHAPLVFPTFFPSLNTQTGPAFGAYLPSLTIARK